MRTNKPRIAILHYTTLPIIGGVEHVIAEHRRLFLNAGYPVTLIAGRGDAGQFADAPIIVIPEIDSEYPANMSIGATLDEGRVPAEFARLQTQIEKRLLPILSNVDFLFVHNVLHYHFNMPLTAALYHLIETRPTPHTIAWCHDISRYVDPASGFVPRYGFPWDLLRTARREITYVAVSSRRQRMLAATLGASAETIRVISNGVAPALLWGLTPSVENMVKAFDLLSAGVILLMPIRVTRAKNIEYALRVIVELKALGLGPKMLITGPPDPHVPDTVQYFQELDTLRAELGIEHEAIFLYEKNVTLDLASVAALYRVCDIVLLPSHREGFGLPVLEAGLAGKPIFTTNVPIIDEIGVDAVHLIAPEEPAEQVAVRIRDWMERTIEHRLRRRVCQQFSWEQIFAHKIEPLVMELQHV